MARVLLARRARVPLVSQPTYRLAAAALAARFAARGQHIWLFRSVADPEELLEFREASEPAALRPFDDEERSLDRRLAELARPTDEPLWEEIPLGQEH